MGCTHTAAYSAVMGCTHTATCSAVMGCTHRLGKLLQSGCTHRLCGRARRIRTFAGTAAKCVSAHGLGGTSMSWAHARSSRPRDLQSGAHADPSSTRPGWPLPQASLRAPREPRPRDPPTAAGMLVLPHSPRWLAARGKLLQAEATLRRLRSSEAQASAEFAQVVAGAQVRAACGTRTSARP
eukprot:2996303-Prymnesium_polylepis.1